MHSARAQVFLEAPFLGVDTPYLAECGVSSSLSGIGSTTTFLRICESGSTLLFCIMRTISEPDRINME